LIEGGWRQRLALGGYSAVCAASLPLTLPLLGLHPRLRGQLSQRLGLGPSHVSTPVWLHGASAGDVAALAPLARRLRARGWPAAISAWTRSGHEMAQARLGDEALVLRAPLDLAGPVSAVLSRLRPRVVVLECLEMWPRLVATCADDGIAVAVVNGRLSARSLRRYRAARWLFEPCFASLRLVTALTEADADRFVAAGAPRDRIAVLPSSKHGELRSCRVARARPKLVLGSVHPAEEEVLLPAVHRLLEARPDLEVVIAPRQVHWAAGTRRRLRRRGPPCDDASRVRVIDRIGLLAEEYGDARLAFVGGSLIAHGGHNLVEPAAHGVPVLFGRHVEHCESEAQRLIASGAGYVVIDALSFLARATRLLDDDDLHAAASVAGGEVARALAAGADEAARRVEALLAEGGR
jgi:3-deoxy-D-manno-octulosonic-acid transferase